MLPLWRLVVGQKGSSSNLEFPGRLAHLDDSDAIMGIRREAGSRCGTGRDSRKRVISHRRDEESGLVAVSVRVE
jgi:hypothetical protein